ncbi:MAG: hypothetical protein H0X68_04285 [Chloroflexi bacterium]|nr:hypothetical protein [Chloroflexota bacterium]
MLVLAIIAALFGAPTNVSAAGNELSAAPAVGRTTSGTDDDATPATDGLLNVVLLVGLSGIAAVALIGVAVMLAGRRRDPDDEAAVPAAAAFAARARSSPDATPDAVMERRMLRQSRVRMTDDPILAALGIGNDDDDRRRARRNAGQVSRGPGERPNISRN